MNSMKSQKSKTSPNRLNADRWTFNRVVALALCASMALSSFSSLMMPTRAESGTSGGNTGYENLYIREADDNTMDSYVQASLGGLVYTQYVDGVSTATVRNNYGTRYAGEVWSDLSVFAAYTPVAAGIRPFEAGHVYSDKNVKSVYVYNADDSTWTINPRHEAAEYDRALATLHYWIDKTYKGIDYTQFGFDKEFNDGDFKEALVSGSLTAAQARALNDAVNAKILEQSGGYGYSGDGDFDGKTLVLKSDTDGVNSTVDLLEGSDFLQVFSALGSSQLLNDNVQLPMNVVFVVDTSSSMGSHDSAGTSGKDRYAANYRLAKTANALNAAFKTVMESNPQNQVALITYDTNAEVYLKLDRYKPITTRENRWPGGDGHLIIDPDKNDRFVDGGKTTYIEPFDYPAAFADQYDYFIFDKDALTADGTVSPPAKFSIDNTRKDAKDGKSRAISTRANMIALLRNVPTYKCDRQTFQYVQLNMTNSAGETKDEWIGIHSGTNTHQGLYEGLAMLLDDETQKTATIDTVFGPKSVPRIPVVILLSDGAPSYATTSDLTARQDASHRPNKDTLPDTKYVGSITDWWEPIRHVKYQESAGTTIEEDGETINNYRVNLVGQPTWGGWGLTLPYLFTAAHMKQKVNMEYFGFANPADAANTEDYPGLRIITVGIDSSATNVAHEQDLISVMLNPSVRLYQEYVDAHDIDLFQFENIVDSGALEETDFKAALKRVLSDLHIDFSESAIDELPFDGLNPDGTDDWNVRKAFVKLVNQTLKSLGFKENEVFFEDCVYTKKILFAINAYLYYDDQTYRDDIEAALDRGSDTGYTAYLNGRNDDYEITGVELQVDGNNTHRWATMSRAPQGEGSGVYDIDWDTMRYNDAFYDVSANDLAAVLDGVASSLKFTGTIFAPVTGTNAAGVADSLTYVNPIGDYMTVDDITDLTMFGDQYKVEKYAVYDYKTNEALLAAKDNDNNNPFRSPGTSNFINEGWYKETAKATDAEKEGALIAGGYIYRVGVLSGKTEADMWKAGWVKRVTYLSAQQAIPTLKEAESQDDLTDKQKNTIYTIYRITEQYGTFKDEDGNPTGINKQVTTQIWDGEDIDAVESRTRTNLSYSIANDIIKNTEDEDSGASGGETGGGAGGEDPDSDKEEEEEEEKLLFDLLDDITIWVEDTGDFRDIGVGGFVVESGYSEALYIDINVNALPTQVARVDLNPDTFIPIRYKTNLSDTKASTPLRLFFDVSLNPKYLRYQANKEKTKANAVGVALTSVSSEYIEAHTGEKFAGHEGRYTAFYSNYFTNNIYNDYAVVSDTNKDSRGNPTMSFSPGAQNQFYRFQKNRVLFMIPGSYGSLERPAEIDFGDLLNAWWKGEELYDLTYSKEQVVFEGSTEPDEEDEEAKEKKRDIREASLTRRIDGLEWKEKYWYDVDNKVLYRVPKQTDSVKSPNDLVKADDFTKVDPTDYTQLQLLLKIYRGDLDGDGSGRKATYWAFGDCVPVTGGSLVATGHNENDPTIHDVIKSRENDPKVNASLVGKLHEDFEERLVKDGLVNDEGHAYQPDISSENWYYIIREFYYPTFEGGGSASETEDVEVRYMAIARKGSELGTGVGTGGQEFVCWYSPDYNAWYAKEYADYLAYLEKIKKGEELEEGELPPEEPKHSSSSTARFDLTMPNSGKPDGSLTDGKLPYFVTDGINTVHWFVSAEVGGLRVGGLANFAGVKGYDVREGVSEGKFYTDTDVIDASNLTQTAKTFFLPTISTYATDTLDADGNPVDGIVVNAYHGNNGRILVDDTTLAVTKTINNLANERATGTQTKAELFKFEVEIEDFYGERGAVIITRDEFNPSLWRRRFDNIDVYTDNRDLLLGNDGDLAMVDAAGGRVIAVYSEGGNAFTSTTVGAYQDEKGDYFKYYYADKGEDRQVDYADGNLIPDYKKGSLAQNEVYYVYVGRNLRSGLYEDNRLRVFKADVVQEQDQDHGYVTGEGGVMTGLGDIYGNESLRGGRNYYLTLDQYMALNAEVKEKGLVVIEDDANFSKEELAGIREIQTSSNYKDYFSTDGRGSRFVFHIITSNEIGSSTNYVSGDREFWINKVYLIPVKEVDDQDKKSEEDKTGMTASWSWGSDYMAPAVPDPANPTGNTGYYENSYTSSDNFDTVDSSVYDNDGDWRTGYVKETEDKAILGEHSDYKLLSQFKVAHIRSLGDAQAATTATDLSSNNGFSITSSFLTFKVEFKYCDNQNHNHGSTAYGIAQFWLTDGQGLGFNNIKNRSSNNGQIPVGSGYSVTEYISADQDENGIRFQQVQHVHQKDANTPKSTYNYGDDIVDDPNHISSFTPGEGNTSEDKYHYTIKGQTSSMEQSIHYVNFVPDIAKVEFMPGRNGEITRTVGDSVSVNEEITYAIRWENFAFDTNEGKAVPATVTVTDILDEGLEFVSATFNPDHRTEAVEQDEKKTAFDAEFLAEYDELLRLRGRKNLNGEEQGRLDELEQKWDNNSHNPIKLTAEGAGDGVLDTQISEKAQYNIGQESVNVTVTYKPDETGGSGGTVTWEIDKAPQKNYGYVELTLKVKSNAIKWWQYEDVPETGKITDEEVVNRASVEVISGDISYPPRLTETIRNPIDAFQKQEEEPGKGKVVNFGDQVYYTIDWSNTNPEPETKIVIKDRLDPGVNFYMAGISGIDPDKTVEINPEEDGTFSGYERYQKDPAATVPTPGDPTEPEPTDKPPMGYEQTEGLSTKNAEIYASGASVILVKDANPTQVEIEYDPDPLTRTITWTLTGVPPLCSGSVYFRVVVNDNADFEWTPEPPDLESNDPNYDPDENNELGEEEDNLIKNRARMQIDDKEWVYSDIIENPTKSFGDLIISKTVSGEGVDWKEVFHFTVTLTPPDGVELKPEYSYTGDSIEGVVAPEDRTMSLMRNDDGTYSGEIQLTHGQSIRIKDLPDKVAYTVTEKEANQNDYKTTVTGDEKGTIPADDTAKVAYNNHKEPTTPDTGNLTVSKTVTGDAGDTTKEFHFTVTLTPPDGVELKPEYSYTGDSIEGVVAPEAGTMSLTRNDDGTYKGSTITLKHGQSITIKDLPTGTGYTVTETEANQDGYVTTVTDGKETGTIFADDPAKAAYENHKGPTTPDTGNLTVSKTVTGDAGDTTKEFHFTVTLTPPDGVELKPEYSYTGDSIEGVVAPEAGTMSLTHNDDGTYKGSITLKHGQSITIKDLPTGTGYTVTETEANQDGYTTTATGNEKGTIPANDTAKAAYNNHKGPTTPDTGNLTVSKTVTGNEGDTTKEFHFTVTLTPPDGVELKPEYSYTGDSIEGVVAPADGTMSLTPNGDGTYKGSITLKHGQSVTIKDLPVGTGYTVTETEANQDGYTTTATGNEKGTIPANDTAKAAFTNYKGPVGDLTVSKTVTGAGGSTTKDFTFTMTLSDTSINGTYGDMTFVNGVSAFTLKHGESKTAKNLPAGITYTVTETEANQDGYTTTATGDTGEVTVEKTAAAVFTNHRDPSTGSLAVRKTVTGNKGDTAKEFTFTVTLSDKTINGVHGGMTFVNGVATFKLKHNESKIAAGLPAGITYTVTETEANQDGYTTTATGDTGTIPDGGTAEAAFVNGKNDTPPSPSASSLTVSKTVTGNKGDTTKEFTFTVTLSDKTINGVYGGMTFVNGVATFKLRHNESKTATGLPAGITYVVTEAEANQDGYTTTATGNTGTIPGGGTAKAAFVNSKNGTHLGPPTGSLTVSKTVSGNSGERNRRFHFIVTLSDHTINGIYGDVTFVNGSASFTLKHGESKTISNLPDGVTYTVTEIEANQDGYTTEATGARGTIADGWHNLVSFMNYRENPDIPKTGDESRFVLWMVMLGLSLTGLLISLIYTVESSVPVGVRGGKRLVGRKGKRLKR